MEFVDRYESPEALAECATAPIDVCRMVFAIGRDKDGITALRGETRQKRYVRQRLAVIWAASEYTRASLRPIGRALNLDHSRCVRGYYQADALRRRDPSFRRMCDGLRDAIR